MISFYRKSEDNKEMNYEWHNPLFSKPTNKPSAPNVLVELKDGRTCNAFWSLYWYACEEGWNSIHLCKLIKRWRYYTPQEEKQRREDWERENIRIKRQKVIPRFLEMVKA